MVKGALPGKSQGNQTNSTGNTLESVVLSVLGSKGFVAVRYRDYISYVERFGQAAADAHYGQELLFQNVPYRSIYGHNGNTEFLLRSSCWSCRIRIECKWQQTAGSVDEKYPYLYLNCLEAMLEEEILILLDGGGAKPTAVHWLKDAARQKLYAVTPEQQSKNIEVMNLVEFVTWANKRFR
ncbi:PD-(D/E)XK nuclease superfamily protein [Heliobacterium mobile]|uniref:PD-(D/E)XK nuclease superfamily protein n=1 Tax=Heliobacterium mobile TaxID=28064 RepID=UPI001A9BD834|nr:PD-(D/E)XK nuclease superfamily protein [Heliobacterium mobile]